MLDIYTYIAANSPNEARRVIRNYGYNFVPERSKNTAESLGVSLKELVANEGEQALKDIVKLHPDKELIIEFFGQQGKKECDCSERVNKLESHFMNFSGSSARGTENQVHIMFLGAALLIAAAIIVKK